MNRMYFIYILTFIIALPVFSVAGTRPSGLTVNFLSDAGQVYLNGYPVNTPLFQATGQKENFQFAAIAQKKPFFGWIVVSDQNNTVQTDYRVLVSSSMKNLAGDNGDMWDCGKIQSNSSINVVYGGKPLEPDHVYFWKVKTWDNHGFESDYSAVSQFVTASQLVDYATARYPVQKQDQFPVNVKEIESDVSLADFGKAAFGRLRVTLKGEKESDTVVIHMGEALKNGRIDRNPAGTIRYSSYKLGLKKGLNTYLIAIRPDRRNTGSQAILIPEYIGEVTPFRYCEIENYGYPLKPENLIRESAFYPFNEGESSFSCSDSVINKVWDLCRYSIKATSFLGVYIDGDRERIPYEADAYINQLCHYGVAREYGMARYSHEYLINRPTWPTEWILYSVLMAWNDYLYTGNDESLRYFYTDLKAKTLLSLADGNGFISTTMGKVTPEVLKSIHFNGNLRDIVDWPHTGILGLGKNEGGETDGYVFKDVNTVVNALHFRSLVIMEKVAGLLGEKDDQQVFSLQAEKLKISFNQLLFDKKRGVYVDGIGTDHASQHGNMFPLAFGLVPPKDQESVIKFIQSRGLACSVYGSQILMDALYEGNNSGYGLQLLGSIAERSWYNMIRVGSTISLEAWDQKYKPNQDWNHAWGAAPANIIPRKLMGVEPLEPGFGKIRIKPQPASLHSASIVTPTIRGEVRAEFQNEPGKSFSLVITLPANTTGEVWLPNLGKTQKVTFDGNTIYPLIKDKFSVLENVGSGKHQVNVSIN